MNNNKYVTLFVEFIYDWIKNKFQNSFYLNNHFISSKFLKKHNITNHINWFFKKIEINSESRGKPKIFDKYSIYSVDFWMNIWSEINWLRPCLIYKNNRHNNKDIITIIPFSSYNIDKKISKFDILIKSDEYNKLSSDSLLRIDLLSCISKKRIKKKIWVLDKSLYKYINPKIIQLIWIK